MFFFFCFRKKEKNEKGKEDPTKNGDDFANVAVVAVVVVILYALVWVCCLRYMEHIAYGTARCLTNVYHSTSLETFLCIPFFSSSFLVNIIKMCRRCPYFHVEKLIRKENFVNETYLVRNLVHFLCLFFFLTLFFLPLLFFLAKINAKFTFANGWFLNRIKNDVIKRIKWVDIYAVFLFYFFCIKNILEYTLCNPFHGFRRIL